LALAPNGMNVLRELGLARAVAERGVRCAGFEFANAADQIVTRIDRREDEARFGAPLTMIRRADLHAVLLQGAHAHGVEVGFGNELTALSHGPRGPLVAELDGERSEAGDVLVGCDGVGSTVRMLCFPDAPEPRPLHLWDYGGFARGVEVPITPGVNRMLFGRRAFFGALPTPSGEVWWFHNGPPGEGRPAPGPHSRERLLALHADDPPWIRDCIRATPEILGPWPLREMGPLRSWSDGRVALIGDAAHAMSPSAGQGASMAMEDAMVLAMSLRDVEDPAEAFRTFERIRRPRVAKVVKQARRNSSGKAAETRFGAWLRDRLLPLFLRLGGAAQERIFDHHIRWSAAVA
jgi:2-polyprenyl-6-methoxyphenol hydroxylase-like FAD-dependent oxidoreductase